MGSRQVGMSREGAARGGWGGGSQQVLSLACIKGTRSPILSWALEACLSQWGQTGKPPTPRFTSQTCVNSHKH